jgi:spermidine synthase
VKLKIGILVAIIVNVSLFVCEDTIQRKIELQIFKITENTKIESSFQTPYQKVLVTSTPVFDFEEKGTQKPSQWVSVYLNNYLQSQAMLDDKTDYYHHSFVHPAMLLSTDRKNILILGGGDGFPAKEVEKYSDAQKITIVDLDKQWTDFSSTDALMTSVNNKALTDPRVEIINADAFQWVRKSKLKYDVIMVDFPEGLDTALARSYSKEFILDLSKILSDSGIVSFETETFLDKSFWSVVKTIKKNGFHVLIHHTVHPESESNGLILMSKLDIDINRLYSFDSQFTFIRPEFFISKKEIEELNQSEFIQRQIKDIDENSFFKPTFLKYYKSQWPWKITIGAGIN